MDSVTGRIDVISDAICPWCYIGKRQLELALPMLAEQGLNFEVHWHPYQLNPEMPAEGVERAAYRLAKFGSEEKMRQIDARVAEAGAAVGIEMRSGLMRRTPNTIAAHRLIWLAGEEGVQDAVVDGLFRGYFSEGKDIGDAAVLGEIGAAAGLAAERVAAMLASDEGLEIVTARDAMARSAGINGVPSFVMLNHVLFSGAVPAEQMAEAFERAWTVLSDRAQQPASK